jgi:hypothetical protein
MGCVDEDHLVRAFPEVHQLIGAVVTAESVSGAHSACDLEPGAIVTTTRVAHSDHQSFHPRSTVRSRK